MTTDPRDLEISRVMRAPRARVWRAFADPALLAQWWCPKPWVTEVKAFDLRPGGAFHTYMTGPLPDGTQGESDNPGCFLDVVPEVRVVGTSMLLPGWRPATPWMGLTNVFTLSDVDGGTLVHALAMHASAEDSGKHAQMGFYDGWGTMLSQWDACAAELSG
ncbi:MAG: SRPBCC domain-containing protein [Alphaproteobacteria bacterium]|nr:SRPBCC domain-containing protein [Alphaproteobacteria bacterium]